MAQTPPPPETHLLTRQNKTTINYESTKNPPQNSLNPNKILIQGLAPATSTVMNNTSNGSRYPYNQNTTRYHQYNQNTATAKTPFQNTTNALKIPFRCITTSKTPFQSIGPSKTPFQTQLNSKTPYQGIPKPTCYRSELAQHRRINPNQRPATSHKPNVSKISDGSISVLDKIRFLKTLPSSKPMPSTTNAPQQQLPQQHPPQQQHHEQQQVLSQQQQAQPNIFLPQTILKPAILQQASSQALNANNSNQPNNVVPANFLQLSGRTANFQTAQTSGFNNQQTFNNNNNNVCNNININNNNNNQTSNNQTTEQAQRAQAQQMIKYQVSVNGKVFKILRVLGSGGSAKVFEGFDPQLQKNVAIKIVNLSRADPITHASYFNEVNLLKSLKEVSRVVRMHDFEYKSNCNELLLVMEQGDTDLAHVIDGYFRRRTENTIDGIFVKYYWRGMLLAVNEIHKRGIVHADLKPVNFILVKNEIKLIDFGIANAIEPNDTSIIRDFQIGTMNYMAPESLKNRSLDGTPQGKTVNSQSKITTTTYQEKSKKTAIKYNSKADIWSLGCILYNLVYGRPPFDKYKEMLAKKQAIVDPNVEIEFPTIGNEDLLYCLKSCLKYYPQDRPSADQLLNHPYLTGDMIKIVQN